MLNILKICWKCAKVRNVLSMNDDCARNEFFLWFCSCCSNSKTVILCFLSNVTEFDDYAEIVDDDPDYAHPMAGRGMNLVKTASLLHLP